MSSYSEEFHVHRVYQEIAQHFSSTRYKPWPVVETFLLQLPPGSCGCDIGCGNGKYLAVNPEIFILGSDRSSNLISIAHHDGKHESFVADGIDAPYATGRFDFAISIAVVHHFASAERRQEAIRTILGTLNSIGRCLIFVWALEQKSSRRGWDESSKQDVLVPWVTTVQSAQGKASGQRTLNRYYHLYREGELERDIRAAGGLVVQAGFDRDNWWAIARRL